MGTNFYVQFERCPHCNRSERLHLGKLSYGWVFDFRGYPGVIETVEDWATFFIKNDDAVITNDYGVTLTTKEFFDMAQASYTEESTYYKHTGKLPRRHIDDWHRWSEENTSGKGYDFCDIEFS